MELSQSEASGKGQQMPLGSYHHRNESQAYTFPAIECGRGVVLNREDNEINDNITFRHRWD